jgi:hypothetical protein
LTPVEFHINLTEPEPGEQKRKNHFGSSLLFIFLGDFQAYFSTVMSSSKDRGQDGTDGGKLEP